MRRPSLKKKFTGLEWNLRGKGETRGGGKGGILIDGIGRTEREEDGSRLRSSGCYRAVLSSFPRSASGFNVNFSPSPPPPPLLPFAFFKLTSLPLIAAGLLDLLS